MAERVYNLPIKVLNETGEANVRNKLYSGSVGILVTECPPYVGKMLVYRTLEKKYVEQAETSLKGIEGILVLPITETGQDGTFPDFKETRSWTQCRTD